MAHMVLSFRFCKLGLQELYNVWRKRALAALQQEVHQSRGRGSLTGGE